MAGPTPFPIIPPSGVVINESSRLVEGRFISVDKARFTPRTDGGSSLEKIGGRLRVSTVPTTGTPRGSHAWRDNNAVAYMAVGTYAKLYVYDTNFAQNDITPYRATGTLGNNPITTQAASSVITVAHTAHGLNVGDTFTLAGSTAVGGITPNGTFPVASTPDLNTYTYNFTSPAVSGATGGGNAVTYKYEINIGSDFQTYGYGVGVGPWGGGTWGTARSSSTLSTEPRVWSADHFGQILLASYNTGSLYSFDPTQAQPWPRAAIVSAAPTDIRFIYVTPERFVVALRTGMVISWCTQADYTVWTPSSTNTANTRTLTEGTRLIGGIVLGPMISLIFSDAACYLLQWTGNKYVHDSRMIGRDCGLIGPKAVVSVGGVAYWMGSDNFWMSDGGSVQQMPNVMDIRDYVFNNMTTVQSFQFHAWYNAHHQEVWFFYTLVNGSNPTNYVIYNLRDQRWAPGTWTDTTGTHFTQGDTRPYCFDADGYVYQRENGFDDNGSVLTASAVLAPYAMNEGLQNMQVSQFLLDLENQVGDVSLTINTYDRLNDAAVMDTETETMTTTTGILDTRVSGRYIGLSLTSSILGGYFKVGKPVAFIDPIGIRS